MRQDPDGRLRHAATRRKSVNGTILPVQASRDPHSVLTVSFGKILPKLRFCCTMESVIN